MSRSVEVRRGLVQLVFAFLRCRPRSLNKICNLSLRKRFEGSRRLKCLLQDCSVIKSRNLHRDRQIQAIMQCFDWCHGVAVEYEMIAKALHAQGRDPLAG